MQRLEFTKRQMYNYSLRLKKSLKLPHRIIATLLGTLKSRAVSYTLLCAYRSRCTLRYWWTRVY